ncbi:MAG: hypothetical protein Q7T21_14740 [Gallionella sp.]|nr:hypothetical protein [Gallionella sp.]
MSFLRNNQADPFLPGSQVFVPRQPLFLLGEFAPKPMTKSMTMRIKRYRFLKITDYHLHTNNTLKLPDQSTNNSSIRAFFTLKKKWNNTMKLRWWQCENERSKKSVGGGELETLRQFRVSLKHLLTT